MIVVLDTNVIVSALISPLGTPARILSLWRQGHFTVVISGPLLAELRRAMTYPRVTAALRRPAQEVEEFLDEFASIPITLPTRAMSASRDPDDNRFLEVALAGKADYLVSGDRDLLDLEEFEGIAIVTPARFLAILETTPG